MIVFLAVLTIALIWVVYELSSAPIDPGEWTADTRDYDDIPEFLRERGKK